MRNQWPKVNFSFTFWAPGKKKQFRLFFYISVCISVYVDMSGGSCVRLAFRLSGTTNLASRGWNIKVNHLTTAIPAP